MDRQDEKRPRKALPRFRRSLVTSAIVHGTLVATALALGLGPLAGEGRKQYDTAVAVAPPPAPPAPPEEQEPEREPEKQELPDPESVPLDAPEPLPELPEPEPELAEVELREDVFASFSLEPMQRIERAPEPVPEVAEAEPAAPVEPPVVATTIEPVVTAVAILNKQDPAYPRAAARLGQEGSVLLRFHVAANGRVTNVEVVEGSGFERLDQAALAAAASWTFEPATENGVAIAGSLDHRVVFRLTEASR